MSASLAERLRAWSHQRLLGQASEDPLDALRKVGAVYSAHPSGPLSLLARCAPFPPARFGVLERERAAVRLPAMRGSVFLFPRELAPAAFAAVRMPEDALATRLRALGVDVRTYETLKPRILEATREPLAPRELQKALGAGQEAVWAMRIMAREGLVLRVGWDDRVRSDGLRWVAAESWLGAPLELPDPEEALGRLAEVYFRIFGPARVVDFAWWAGVSQARAEAAGAPLGLVEVEDGHRLPPELAGAYAETVAPGGGDTPGGATAPPGQVAPRGQAAPYGDAATPRPQVAPRGEAAAPPGQVAPHGDAAAPPGQGASPGDSLHVLPKWDPYTMAYAPDGRARLVEDAHLPLAYSTPGSKVGATSGDGQPLLVRSGRAVATWEHKLAGRRIRITVRPFGADMLPARDRVEGAFQPLARLFEGDVELAVEEG